MQRERGHAPALQPGRQVVRDPALGPVRPAGSRLERERHAPQQGRSRPQHLLQLALPLQQRRARAPAADQVDGAAGVEVDEIKGEARAVARQQLARAPHRVREAAAQLQAEARLGGVAAQEGPLGGAALQQAGCERHLAARHLRAQAAAQRPERQVAHRRQRRQVQLAREVQRAGLARRGRRQGSLSARPLARPSRRPVARLRARAVLRRVAAGARLLRLRLSLRSAPLPRPGRTHLGRLLPLPHRDLVAQLPQPRVRGGERHVSPAQAGEQGGGHGVALRRRRLVLNVRQQRAPRRTTAAAVVRRRRGGAVGALEAAGDAKGAAGRGGRKGAAPRQVRRLGRPKRALVVREPAAVAPGAAPRLEAGAQLGGAPASVPLPRSRTFRLGRRRGRGLGGSGGLVGRGAAGGGGAGRRLLAGERGSRRPRRPRELSLDGRPRRVGVLHREDGRCFKVTTNFLVLYTLWPVRRQHLRQG